MRLLTKAVLKFKSRNSLCLFLLFFCLSFKAQETLNMADVEQKTYQLYLDQNWKELIKAGNDAITQGIDYFYLRMRIGIAYYEKKNYCGAEEHFKKALTYNTDDALAQEYLYYCYVFMGRPEQARWYSKSVSDETYQKIGKRSPIGSVMVEAGTKIADSTSYYDSNKKTQSNYFDPATYVQIGVNHYVRDRVSLFHALTYYGQVSFVGTLKQSQYYLKAAIPLKKDWLISPAVHIAHVNFVSVIYPTRPATVTLPPILMGPPPQPTTVVYNSNYFIGSLVAQKTIAQFNFGIGSTFSNMSGVNQILHHGTISYSPFCNSKLVIGGTAYVHTIDSYKTTYVSASPFIYVQPIKMVSLKVNYLMNVGNNIIEDNGYLVNNSPDLTKNRVGLILNFHLNKHLTLYGVYQLENKHELGQGFNYRYNVYLGGIKFTP
jgi:tetratricopeptide (TPR) repeat protein